MSSWKRDFASGLVVLVPLLVIAFVLNWLYSHIADLPVIQDIPQPYGVLIALVVFVMLVFSVGYLMRTALGRLIEAAIDGLINRLPVLRVVYNASKLAVETALTGADDLQKPVKLETWNGLRMTAFKTGKTTDDGREMLFLPTSPNITTGFVVEVDPDRLTETDERVEEALTRVLSAGFGEQEERGVPVDVHDATGGGASGSRGVDVDVGSEDDAAGDGDAPPDSSGADDTTAG